MLQRNMITNKADPTGNSPSSIWSYSSREARTATAFARSDEGLGLAWRSSGEWSGERAEHEAGFFLIRDSVDHVAGRLDVSATRSTTTSARFAADRRYAACALTAILSHQFGVVVEQPQ